MMHAGTDAGTDAGIRDDLLAMRRYARSLTRDDQDADDVVQDALLRAIERQETFQPDRSRRRWLLAIVHNVFFSGKRREASEARRNSRFAETLADRLEPGQEEHARLGQIARQFAALPEHHRAVLHLTAIEGLSYQQAAETLGVPLGTVMSRLARARATLREREQGQEQGQEQKQPGAAGLRLIGGSDD